MGELVQLARVPPTQFPLLSQVVPVVQALLSSHALPEAFCFTEQVQAAVQDATWQSGAAGH
jgi:hypothetical protein